MPTDRQKLLLSSLNVGTIGVLGVGLRSGNRGLVNAGKVRLLEPGWVVRYGWVFRAGNV